MTRDWNRSSVDWSDYTTEQTFKPGDRVELHPGCDLWMQGAKYGTIHGASIAVADAWLVRMDNENVKGLKTFKTDRLRRIGGK